MHIINRTYSLISLHQILPFFTLCLDIIGNPNHENLDEDLVSVTWICDYVEMIVEERFELKPVIIIMKAMVTACQQTKMDRLAQSVATGENTETVDACAPSRIFN